MPAPSKLIQWAFWLTLAFTFFLALGAVFTPLPWLPVAALLGFAAFRLRRGSRAAAYLAAALLLYPFWLITNAFLRNAPALAGRSGDIISSALFTLPSATLCLLAARQLSPSPLWERSLLGLVLAAVLVLPLAFQPFIIPTTAMAPTLDRGDQILVRVAGSPALTHGQIVVFRYPVDPAQTFTKRIVALPGDRLRIRDKKLFRNGAPVPEPYVRHATDYFDSFRDNFPADPNVRLPNPAWAAELAAATRDGELLVPPGKYFVLGDNRDLSLDSRYWGFLDAAAILGTPVLIYYSATSPSSDVPRLTPFWQSTLHWQRFFTIPR